MKKWENPKAHDARAYQGENKPDLGTKSVENFL